MRRTPFDSLHIERDRVTIHVMRTSLFLGTALSVFLLSGLASAAQINFTATLDTASETTPLVKPSTATGTADATYDTDKKKLCVVITYKDMTSAVNATHIHTGPAGQPGPNVVDFVAPFDSPLADVFNITDPTLQAKFENIAANPMYFNVHTADNTAGELRGQIAEGGKGVDCNDEEPDAGSSSGSSGASSGSSGSSGTSGATTTPADGGTTSSSGSDDSSSSSCSTTGSSPLSTGGPILLGLAIAGAVASRARRKK